MATKKSKGTKQQESSLDNAPRLSKDQILSAAQKLFPVEIVDESGDLLGVVFRRQIKATDALEFSEKNDARAAAMEIIERFIVNEEGVQMFTKEEVGQLPIRIFNALTDAIIKEFGITPEQVEEGKAALLAGASGGSPTS